MHTDRSFATPLARAFIVHVDDRARAMAVTWADAGNPKSKVTLADAQAWAVEYGFVKTDVPKDRPIAQRVDMVAFFNVYNATAFSAFRKKFKTRRLKPPNEPQVRRPATPRRNRRD